MNTPLRSRAKTFVTKAKNLIDANDLEAAEQAAKDAGVALDKAAKRRAIHPNNAARRKSRLARLIRKAREE